MALREGTLTLGTPVVVAQASPEVAAWGPCQFPRAEWLADGTLHVTYHIHADSATAYGLSQGHAISTDGGNSWRAVAEPPAAGGLLLPNGDRLLADQEPSRPAEALALPAPAASIHASYVDYAFHRPDVLPGELRRAWPMLRRPAGEETWRREWATVRPAQAADVRVVSEGVFVTPFFEQDRIRVAADGTLLATLYALPQLDGRNRVIRPFLSILVRSDDGGRHWDEVGAVPYLPDPQADPAWDARDGFSEPEVQELPDGSLFCLLRTTDGNGVGPLYCSRSADRGRSWCPPVVFDECGVWPQLLTLACGTTLTAYGRPGLYLRVAVDPGGRAWSERVTVVPPKAVCTDTCSYADLIAVADDTALLLYSQFDYPNADGQPCKTILCRTVQVG